MRTKLQHALKVSHEELYGKAFEAFYTERRIVPAMGSEYRGIIELPPYERALINDLNNCLNRFREVDDNIYVPYTDGSQFGQPRSPALWLRLPSGETPLGCYWFQFKSVALLHNELVFDLNNVRYLPDRDLPSGDSSQLPASGIRSDDSSDATMPKIDAEFILKTIKIIIIVMTTLVVGAFKLVEFLGEFTIKLTRELSNLVYSSHPLMDSILNFITRLMAGFFTFITILCRGDKPIRVQNIPAIDDRACYDRYRKNYAQNYGRDFD